jgi:hypothetical protein
VTVEACGRTGWVLLAVAGVLVALAGFLLLGQHIPVAAIGGIAVVILASAGATASARPPGTAAPGQLATAGAPSFADTVFADTGGVGRHASPGSTTNVYSRVYQGSVTSGAGAGPSPGSCRT